MKSFIASGLVALVTACGAFSYSPSVRALDTTKEIAVLSHYDRIHFNRFVIVNGEGTIVNAIEQVLFEKESLKKEYTIMAWRLSEMVGPVRKNPETQMYEVLWHDGNDQYAPLRRITAPTLHQSETEYDPVYEQMGRSRQKELPGLYTPHQWHYKPLLNVEHKDIFQRTRQVKGGSDDIPPAP